MSPYRGPVSFLPFARRSRVHPIGAFKSLKSRRTQLSCFPAHDRNKLQMDRKEGSSGEACVRVSEVAIESGPAWDRLRAFLAAHLPVSWKLFGVILRREIAAGTSVPHGQGQRWFVATSSSSSSSSSGAAPDADPTIRGVLLVLTTKTAIDSQGKHQAKASVSMFVPDRSDEQAARALLSEGIDWSVPDEVRFTAVDQAWLPIVREVASAGGAREVESLPCLLLHCLEKELKAPFTLREAEALVSGQSLRLGSITSDPADLQAIASEWVYSEYWTYEKEYVASCTCHAPSSAIHSGKDLVAWIGLHWDMSLGFFAVLEAFQRRGLGKVLALDLTLRTFDYLRPHVEPEQVGAFAFVETAKEASKSLFLSLGYQSRGEVFWGHFIKSNE